MNILWSILIGIVAGFLAGLVMKGRGFGCIGNLIVGVIGAVLGDLIFGAFGVETYGLVGRLLSATAGAVVFLFVVGLIRPGKG